MSKANHARAAIAAKPEPQMAALVREWRIVHGQLQVDVLKANKEPADKVDDIVAAVVDAADRKLEGIEGQILGARATSMEEVRAVLELVLAGMKEEGGHITERRTSLLKHLSECIRWDLPRHTANRAA